MTEGIKVGNVVGDSAFKSEGCGLVYTLDAAVGLRDGCDDDEVDVSDVGCDEGEGLRLG